MKTLSQALATFAFAFALVSCGNVLQDDGTKALDDRNNQDLLQLYSTVTGVYQGTFNLEAEKRTLNGQIVLFISYKDNGVDSGNQDKSRPVLRAQFKLDAVGEFDDHNFKVDLHKYSGEIKMIQDSGSTVTACQVGPRDPGLAIHDARVVGGKLTGSVFGQVGRLGTVSMSKVAGEAQEARDQAERLKKAYARVTGTYNGFVDINGDAVAANMIFSIEEKTIVQGEKCPYLKANFKFKDAIGILNDTKFLADYRESSSSLLIAVEDATSADACTVGNPDATLKLADGRLGNGKVSGTLMSSSGMVGRVSLTRTSPNTNVDNDAEDRLVRAYSRLEGTYGGRFKGPSENFPVKISMWVDKVQVKEHLSCPVLRGIYSRPEQESGNIGIDVDFEPQSSTVEIKSSKDQNGAPCGQPGCRNLSIIEAKWNSNGITGKMKWWNKAPGTIAVKACPSHEVDVKGNCCASGETLVSGKCKR